MPIYETFSKRQKKAEGQAQRDVYQYDHLPTPFRVQVIHIWREAVGPFVRTEPRFEPVSNPYWRTAHDTLARELGVFGLGAPHDSPDLRCEEFLLTAETAPALDIIELTFQLIDGRLRDFPDEDRQDPDDAIGELNHRFGQHGIGYQFAGGKLVRMDSQYVHEEVAKPAISLLQNADFSGPSDEFMRAHEHYRHGRQKEAIAGALKSFESTMKSICDAQGWSYPVNATAKPLLDTVLQKELVPPYLRSHFAGLRTAMASGLPTIRNKTSGHGQGATPLEIPAHFAAYALHLAAANIVFLVEAHKALE